MTRYKGAKRIPMIKKKEMIKMFSKVHRLLILFKEANYLLLVHHLKMPPLFLVEIFHRSGCVADASWAGRCEYFDVISMRDDTQN